MNLGAPNAFIAHTNGNERLRITSAGNVGIGTVSPGSLLHLSASANPEITITDQQTANTSARVKHANGTLTIDSQYNNTSGIIAFSRNNNTSESARFDTSGRLLVGTSTARANLFNATISPGLQLEAAGSLTSPNRIISVVNNFATNGDGGGVLALCRSKGGTLTSNTLVTSGDQLGRFDFQGNDGTQFVSGAMIEAYVDGTSGADDMPGRLVFSTTADGASSPTERMRIDSGGIIYFGQITNPATSTVALRVPTGTGNGINAQIASNTGTSFPWANYNASGTYVGGISCTSTATSFPTSSDYRLKTNVQPLAGAISLVSQLKPSTFEFNENLGETVQGFIAHELQEVVPLAVIGEKDAEDANGNPVYQGVDAAKLVPLLTAALQETLAKIESLEARLTAAGI